LTNEKELRVPTKLIRLIKRGLNEMYSIQTCIKQRDALLPLLVTSGTPDGIAVV
jgi:hypothetical protein